MTTWLSETTSEETQGRQHTYTIGVKARAFRKNGSLRVVPPGFSATGDAQRPHGRQGLLDTRMAERLAGQSPQVHIGRGQNHIRMSALGTANVAGAAVLDADGNVIGRRFNGALAGTDLEWLDGGHYVKEHFHLKPGHLWQYEVRIDDRAGRLVPSARGWDLQDDAGNPVLWAGRGYIYKPDDPLSVTYPVTTTVRTQGGKSIYTYTLPPPLPGKPDWAGYDLDPTWESQPDAAAGKDCYITQRDPLGNYGVGTVWQAGEYSAAASGPDRALIQFTFTGIPPTALVQTASFATVLIADGSVGASNNRTLQLYRLIQAWAEGTGNGLPSGGATWNTHDGTNNWAGAGCSNTVSDREATGIGSAALATTDLLGSSHAFTLTPIAVQEWIRGTIDNNGMIAIADTELDDLYFFASSDGLTASQRPKLTVVTVEQAAGRPRWWLVHRP